MIKEPDFNYEDLKDLDLIEKFVRIVSAITDSPEEFIRAGAYHLIASLLGRFISIPAQPFGHRPNPWFIISSIPGLMRRSTVLRCVLNVYRRALQKFYEKTLSLGDDEEREVEIKERISDSLILEGTVEGLADHIEAACSKGVDCFAIMSPEFGGILKRMASGHYQNAVINLLSSLKYGEEWSQSLSRRGGKKGRRYIPPNLFVTMFSSMQEPKEYITKEQARQGFVRRLLIIYKRPRELDKSKWQPPLKLERMFYWRLLDEYSDELAEYMVKLNSLVWYQQTYDEPLTIPTVISVVDEEINTIAREIDFSIMDKDRVLDKVLDADIYRQGYIENLIHLTVLTALAKGEGRLIHHDDGQTWLMLGPDDLNTAKRFLDTIYAKTEEVFEDIGVTTKPVEVDETVERVYEKIWKAGKEGLITSELYSLGYNRERLKNALQQLLLAERIIVLREGTRTKPKWRYIATAHLTDDEIERLTSDSSGT